MSRRSSPEKKKCEFHLETTVTFEPSDCCTHESSTEFSEEADRSSATTVVKEPVTAVNTNLLEPIFTVSEIMLDRESDVIAENKILSQLFELGKEEEDLVKSANSDVRRLMIINNEKKIRSRIFSPNDSQTPSGSDGAESGTDGAESGTDGAEHGSSGAQHGSSGAQHGSSGAQHGSSGAQPEKKNIIKFILGKLWLWNKYKKLAISPHPSQHHKQSEIKDAEIPEDSCSSKFNEREFISRYLTEKKVISLDEDIAAKEYSNYCKEERSICDSLSHKYARISEIRNQKDDLKRKLFTPGSGVSVSPPS